MASSVMRSEWAAFSIVLANLGFELLAIPRQNSFKRSTYRSRAANKRTYCPSLCGVNAGKRILQLASQHALS